MRKVMRKILIGGMVVLSFIALVFDYHPTSQIHAQEKGKSLPGGNKDVTKIIHELFEDISLLNLINGLNLTEEQIKQILLYNKQIQLLKDQIEELNNKTIEEVILSYNELKSTLEKNEDIPKHIERRASMREQEFREMMEELKGAIADIERELTGILIESQIEIINTFNPCLIPPKDLKNPVRAGQAENSERGLDLLRNVRKMPQELFDKEKNEIVQRHLEMIGKHVGNLTAEEKEQESKRLLKVLEKARSMSDKEFELNGPDLAKQFVSESKKSIGRDKELREELERIHQTRRGGPSRIGRYLFNPRIVPILERRLEIMKNTKQLPPADLDKIKVPR
ncbi:MAG: hypothetical protein QME51_01510 [Planctomycetota bacterium]|nr:hypothetical protein [Planctomycetota bacterium]MDI6787032.1 hypothetical protein [Planctomycetota bacterium]